MDNMHNYSDLEEEWTRGYWKFICDHEDNINWFDISKNPNITWEIIQDNPDKDWGWYGISQNPNITGDTVQNNPDKDWLCKSISGNTMAKGKAKWINNKRLRIIKALQIQRHWRNYSCNPQYILARRLIVKRLKD